MRRRGFSLLELLIVLAIMVAITAMGLMSLQAMSPSFKLNGAIDSVRAAWAAARARAADEDRPYRFSVEPGGRHFQIAPDDDTDPEAAGAAFTDSLPTGVRFVVNGDAPPAVEGDDKAPPSGQWEMACVILPDGTSREDVRIVFSVKGGAPTQLELRGLTGTSYVTRLK